MHASDDRQKKDINPARKDILKFRFTVSRCFFFKYLIFFITEWNEKRT